MSSIQEITSIQEMSSVPEIILHDFFLKQGSSTFTRWKKRYFVLYDNNTLTYSESKTDEPLGEIDLRGVTEVKDDDNKNVSLWHNYSSHGISMQTINKKQKRTWNFCFKTNTQRDLWKEELIKCTKYNHINFDEKHKIKKLIANATKLKQNVQIKNRMYKLKPYKNCFIGDEAVKTIIELNIASNTDKAISFGNLLIKNNIIKHVEREHTFKNGYFFYKFINNNNITNLEDFNVDYEIKNVEGEKDIINLINRCHDNKKMLNKLYLALCNKFESEKNYIKYEKYLDKMGQNDALLHFMKRHTFIHVINYDSNIHNYILNRFCQKIYYNKSIECVTYNYGSLRKLNYSRNSIAYPPSRKQHYKTHTQLVTGHSTNTNDTMSITLSSKHINPKHMSQLGLQAIHDININEIQLFAGLPISINGNVNNDLHDDINVILHRMLPDYRRTILPMLKQWNKNDYNLYTLYDLEGYIGLLFYKTIPGFFESKCKINKIPIPFMDKIEDLKECDNEALESVIQSSNSNINWSDIYLQIDEENKQKCIETFDCIINGKDDAFPKDLNMFNVLIMVWIIYRKHCSHIKCDKNIDTIKIKLQFFIKLINKLFKEFFIELNSRKHLVKYMLILHYYASPKFNCKFENMKEMVHLNVQTQIFEMALNVLKDRKLLSWINKRDIINFLYTHNWIRYYNTSCINIELYLSKELEYIDIELNDIYKQLKDNKYYKYIDSEIKIISGNIIFRQDHQHVLGAMKNKNKCCDDNAQMLQFDEKCAMEMIDISNILSDKFSDIIKTKIFNSIYNNNIKIYKLKTKSIEFVKQELKSMEFKNIKYPKSASIRDYMSCLVIFPTIQEMIKGYQRLEKVSKNYGIRIVHIDNGISKKFNRTILDNFQVINIHVIFTQKNCKPLIGEIIFTLMDIWGKYSIKKYIIDSYGLLLNQNKTSQIAKSISVSCSNIEYDWKIKKLYDIQDQYLHNILHST